ncbi:hypothetical protein TRIUR3_34666 [Triticum urartu]|uniref:Uncharacterized protein n=1 Tax=Triticum urartu TaxID=4572 RepID=M8AI19_TRIUA|nr:hypothetical protein TRIUR3_34666 [Triticum urartu]
MDGLLGWLKAPANAGRCREQQQLQELDSAGFIGLRATMAARGRPRTRAGSRDPVGGDPGALWAAAKLHGWQQGRVSVAAVSYGERGQGRGGENQKGKKRRGGTARSSLVVASSADGLELLGLAILHGGRRRQRQGLSEGESGRGALARTREIPNSLPGSLSCLGFSRIARRNAMKHDMKE